MATAAQDIANALLSYAGPEKDAVRKAIVKLAGEDLSAIRHQVGRAQADYRQILWEATAENLAPQSESMAGLTLYQRLHRLNRVQQWQAVLMRHDRAAARALVGECDYDAIDSEKFSASEFSATK